MPGLRHDHDEVPGGSEESLIAANGRQAKPAGQFLSGGFFYGPGLTQLTRVFITNKTNRPNLPNKTKGNSREAFGLFARHLPRELRGVRGAGQGVIRD